MLQKQSSSEEAFVSFVPIPWSGSYLCNWSTAAAWPPPRWRESPGKEHD